MNKGFTIIELLVVVSIIVLMTSLTLPNYRHSDKRLALQRSAHQMAQNLRLAQEYAISAKEFSGAVPQGYGIYFDLNQPQTYIMFADLNGDRKYSGSSEKVEDIELENQIQLTDLDPVFGSSLSVVFVPPDPAIFFFPDNTLSTITIGANGTEQMVTKYSYFLEDLVYDQSPNPACDTSINSSCEFWIGGSTECPEVISTSASAPAAVYDRCTLWGERLGIHYRKQESQVMGLISKSVQVNKAGLISIQ